MFCQNCGKEINDSAKYCNFCGKSTTHQSTTWKESIMNFFLPLGETKGWLIVTMALLLLNPILAALPIFKLSEIIVGASTYSQTESVFDFLFMLAEELPLVGLLIVIGILSILAAEFFMIFPLCKKTVYTSKNTLATKIISILSIVFIGFLSYLIFTKGSSSNSVTVSLTFWGWLLVLDSIILVITTFMFSTMIQKHQKNKEIEE